MPTIREVAAHACVSPSTVSHVLNNTRFVEPETKKRVLMAIETLGYRSNSLARSLRRRETSTIGLLVPDNSNPFFADVARAIEDVGFAEGYNVILCNSDLSDAKEVAYIDVLLSKQVDGLILIATNNRPEHLEPILRAGVPLVVVDRELGDVPIDQVLVDNELGGYLAGQYLVRLGHRRMVCIAGPHDLTPSAKRITGFRRALAEAGIELTPDEIVPGDFQYAGGKAAMQTLLKRRPDCTAVFAANDLMAIGALNVLSRASLHVPIDISLIGFDNILQSEMMSPSITTIAQPIVEIGRSSAALLIERIKRRRSDSMRLLLEPTLIERETCRAFVEDQTMKKTGVLHHELSQVIASLGHTDMLVIGDAGLPIPPGVPRIDLAVRPGLPTLLDVVQAIATELEAERLIIADELQERGGPLVTEIQACFPHATLEHVPHERLKALSAQARAVVRTGECTPYANVIVCSGVTF
jgi:LacI family transcriptional regulator